MTDTMKLWERVVEYRIRMMKSTSKNQFGLISTMQAIYLLRRLLEITERKKTFTWFSCTFDKLSRDVIWWVLERKVVTKGVLI